MLLPWWENPKGGVGVEWEWEWEWEVAEPGRVSVFCNSSMLLSDGDLKCPNLSEIAGLLFRKHGRMRRGKSCFRLYLMQLRIVLQVSTIRRPDV